MITVEEAEVRGGRDYMKRKTLNHNPYVCIPDSRGATRLMAWWDAGYLKAWAQKNKEVVAENGRC